MKKILSIIVLVSIWSVCTAQWTWNNPQPQGNTLNDVFFYDEILGWAVGENGIIIKTTDGGISWEILEWQISDDIYAVHFLSSQTGLLLTDGGKVYKTTSGGYSWNKVHDGWTSFDLHMVFSNKAWVVGRNGKIYRSTDCGTTWEAGQFATGDWLWSVDFVDQYNGWAVGRSDSTDHCYIIHSQDGGITWEAQFYGIEHSFYSVDFVDQNHGWAVGSSGCIMYTNDGGLSWNKQKSMLGDVLESVFFKDENQGWAVSSSKILRTTDGGNTWEIQENFGGKSIHFAGNNGFVVGHFGTMYQSLDGGDNWHKASIGFGCAIFNDIQFTDKKKGWAVGDIILHTKDGGYSWEEQLRNRANFQLKSVFFVDSVNGWGAGHSYWDGLILATNDGGKSWNSQGNPEHTIYSIHFINKLEGWCAGSSEQIFHTTDGGENWEPQSGSSNVSYFSIYFKDQDTGWAAGRTSLPQGFLIKTVDGGKNWELQDIPYCAVGLNSIYFYDNSNAWIATSSGSLLQSTNGGMDWEKKLIDSTSGFLDVFFTSLDTGWTVGYYGHIYHTTDRGISWTLQSSNMVSSLESVHFTDAKNGFAAGYPGSILSTNNGGIITEILELQKQNKGQNNKCYPNPFTTSTSIEFALDGKSKIQITIYNSIGEAVYQFEDHFDQGTNKVTWSPGHLPVGMYYAVLRSEEGVSVVKMVKE